MHDMRSHGWLLLLLLSSGCDKLQTGNPLDPNAPLPEPVAGTRPLEGGPPVQVFFSKVEGTPSQNELDPDNIAAKCAQAIDSAKETLDVCCYEIDNRAVAQAIVSAHYRGVKVRVMTDTDNLKEVGPLAFQKAGIPVESDNRSGIMHHKFMIVDGRAVWTGSFNFTKNCAYLNNNNGIYIQSDRVAQNYRKWFDWFWTTGRRQLRRTGGPTPFPDVQLPDGTHVEARFTTFDKMDDTVIEVVGEAKKSIKFLAFSFTHAGVAKAMLNRAAAGVKVFGVFESRNEAGSRYHDMLGKPNVSVRLDGNKYNMHHKVIIVDDQVVIAGSYNFSENAGTVNDENYVVLWKNRNLALQFAEEFAKIYRKAGENAATAGDARALR
jgi:phosphatidylserine/phosphatidylglycerophosphate/cardiolipin synthase-like enzyme